MTKEEEIRLRNRTRILAIFAAIVFVMLGLQYCSTHVVTDAYEAGRSYIPTIEQLQQALTDTDTPRYDPCGVDGNPGPNTLRAWKNYSFDIYAGNKRILAEGKE